MKLSAVALTVVAVLAVTASAAADQQIATGPVEPAPEPPPPALDIDARGPVRVGLGTSRLFDSRVLSLSFEDEIDIWRLSRGAMLGVVFGLDAQRAMESKIVDRGFLSTGFGPELALRMPRQGPLFVLSGTAAPLWQSDASATSLAGLGVSFRAEAFPFYQSLTEAVDCERGTLQTYVLSGLSGWALTRCDWLGSQGQSVAVGFSLDLGREFILPVLGAVLRSSCSGP